MTAVHEIVGILTSAAGARRTGRGSSVRRSPFRTTGRSGGAGLCSPDGKAVAKKEEPGSEFGMRRELERDSVGESGSRRIGQTFAKRRIEPQFGLRNALHHEMSGYLADSGSRSLGVAESGEVFARPRHHDGAWNPREMEGIIRARAGQRSYGERRSRGVSAD
jgi:hypothetical protein